MEELLTPSYHGESCRHNGDNPDYEIACDEGDFYLICFPDWEEILEKYDTMVTELIVPEPSYKA